MGALRREPSPPPACSLVPREAVDPSPNPGGGVVAKAGVARSAWLPAAAGDGATSPRRGLRGRGRERGAPAARAIPAEVLPQFTSPGSFGGGREDSSGWGRRA